MQIDEDEEDRKGKRWMKGHVGPCIWKFMHFISFRVCEQRLIFWKAVLC